MYIIKKTFCAILYINSRCFVDVKGACVGVAEPPNLCKEQVMQHFIAVTAHLPSPNITIAVISYNLSTRRCLAHVFRKIVLFFDLTVCSC